MTRKMHAGFKYPTGLDIDARKEEEYINAPAL